MSRSESRSKIRIRNGRISGSKCNCKISVNNRNMIRSRKQNLELM